MSSDTPGTRRFGDWWRENPMSKSRPELYGICEAVWLAASSETAATGLSTPVIQKAVAERVADVQRVDAVLSATRRIHTCPSCGYPHNPESL